MAGVAFTYTANSKAPAFDCSEGKLAGEGKKLESNKHSAVINKLLLTYTLHKEYYEESEL